MLVEGGRSGRGVEAAGAYCPGSAWGGRVRRAEYPRRYWQRSKDGSTTAVERFGKEVE